MHSVRFNYTRNCPARMTEAKYFGEKQCVEAADFYGESCTFCMIAKGDCPYTDILFEDEDFVCFQDIRPGAAHHYLVIPKTHIHSCKSLEAEDISLVKRMAEIGRIVLKSKNVTDLEDISLGFHVPPFITVPHLHLHVLAPFSQLYIEARCKFTAFWYLTVDKLLQVLEKKKNGHQIQWSRRYPE